MTIDELAQIRFDQRVNWAVGEIAMGIGRGDIRWTMSRILMAISQISFNKAHELANERYDKILQHADDLRQVAFDGPREAKGTDCEEGEGAWRKRIEQETRFIKELIDKQNENK